MSKLSDNVRLDNALLLMCDRRFADAENVLSILSPKIADVAFWRAILWSFHAPGDFAVEALCLLFSIWPATFDGFQLGLCFGSDSLLNPLCNAEWPSRPDAHATFKEILRGLRQGAKPHDYLLGGALLLAFGDYPRADRWLTKSLHLGVPGPIVALLRALCRLRYGRFKDALADLAFAEEGFGIRLVGHRLFALNGIIKHKQTRNFLSQIHRQLIALNAIRRPKRTKQDLQACNKMGDFSDFDLLCLPETEALEKTRQIVERRLRALSSLSPKESCAMVLEEDNIHFHQEEYLSNNDLSMESKSNLEWVRMRLATWEMSIAALWLNVKASAAWQRHVMTLFREGTLIKESIPMFFIEPSSNASFHNLEIRHTYADFVTPPEDDHLPLPNF